MNSDERTAVSIQGVLMSHTFIVLVAVSAMLSSQAGSAEQLGGASYRDVCKKFEEDGVTTRTQRGQGTSEVAGELLGNTVVLVDTGNNRGGRQRSNVSNSEIIISGDLNKIATVTGTQPSDSNSVGPAAAGRSSACDQKR